MAKTKNGNKRGRCKVRVLELLLQGEANTHEIYQHLSVDRYAPSMPQVGNLVAKWKLISKLERRDRVGRGGPSYHHDDGAWWTVAVWKIADKEAALEFIENYKSKAYPNRKPTPN